MNNLKVYERIIDERNRSSLALEEELSKVKGEKNAFERRLKEEFEEKMKEFTENNGKLLKKVSEEMEHFQEKYTKAKASKKTMKDEVERLKTENDKLSNALYNTIQNYEKKISEIKEGYESEISELKRKEEEFLKINETLTDSDIYTVYKEIKRKFEDNLKDCVQFKNENEKIRMLIYLFIIQTMKISR